MELPGAAGARTLPRGACGPPRGVAQTLEEPIHNKHRGKCTEPEPHQLTFYRLSCIACIQYTLFHRCILSKHSSYIFSPSFISEAMKRDCPKSGCVVKRMGTPKSSKSVEGHGQHEMQIPAIYMWSAVFTIL